MGDTDLGSGFYDAVARRDISELRNRIVEEIQYGYRLGKNKSDACMQYLKSMGIDICEPYEKKAGEQEVPEKQEQWTKELFYNKVEALRHNFAYEQRMRDIRRIGDVVFKKEQAGSSKETAEPSFFPETPKRAGNRTSPGLVLGILIVIVILLIVILLAVRR